MPLTTIHLQDMETMTTGVIIEGQQEDTEVISGN